MKLSQRLLEKLSLSLVLGLAVAIGVLVFLAWLTDEVLEGDTRRFDEATRAAVHQLASPPLTTVMRGISFLGSTEFLFSATAIIFLAFVLRKWKREGFLLGITMFGASLLNITLKLAFKRVRPEPFFNLATPRSYSFPSGHALASFCFFGALAVILHARSENPRIRLGIKIVAPIIIFLIGFSRIYLGVHHTTDVIAGFTAAFIWTAVVKFVEEQLVRRRKKKKAANDEDS
jgi:membrane-associated phospholipid phosphatase